MMKKIFFISDAHLGLSSPEFERAKEDRLLEFLAHVGENGQALFILGDLFDAWLEYRLVIPKGFHRLLTALEDLTRAGIAVHYLAGNHDYWMRDYFRSSLGVKTYPEPFSVTIEGTKFFLHHGDGLATRDRGYKILKKILRNPVAVWVYSWVHPDIGLRLARASSRQSRDHTAHKNYGESDGMKSFANERFAEGYQIVIMGHRHEPILSKSDHGTYVNLGDWISHYSYAEFSSGRIDLKQWSSGNTNNTAHGL